MKHASQHCDRREMLLTHVGGIALTAALSALLCRNAIKPPQEIRNLKLLLLAGYFCFFCYWRASPALQDVCMFHACTRHHVVSSRVLCRCCLKQLQFCEMPSAVLHQAAH